MTTQFNQRQVLFFISATLIAATLIAYEPIVHNGFVNYDDTYYVTKNPNVQDGITLDSVVRAFTKMHEINWHPLTWLSHMLDCEIYGLNPLGHHITSLLIHIANSLLLFLLLFRMTGSVWKSAFVAAAFALHPIHVESVAWVSERKDILSGLFWMLTIIAYIRYARSPNIKKYLLVLLVFAMGLMSKPMVVTLPFVLLLLDWWPLDRFAQRENSAATATTERQITPIDCPKAMLPHLVVEKVPLIVLSAILSVITFVLQKQSGTMGSLKDCPLQNRIINSLGCYLSYVVKIFYPKGLAVLYPIPVKTTIDSAALAIMGVVMLLVLWGRGRRWLVVGLLYYLGTLVPVIGLVPVGFQIIADRYTYLPSIGVFIIVAWGAEEILSKTRYSKVIAAYGAAAILAAMVVATRIQVGYWHDSGTLYEKTLAVTENNFTIHYNYGVYLHEQGRYDEGIRHFKEAVRLCPELLTARQIILQALLKKNKFDEAVHSYTEALQERNDWPEMHKMYAGLGWAYEQKGDLVLAETNYNKALKFKADYEYALNRLRDVLTQQGKLNESIEQLNAALQTSTNKADIYAKLGAAYDQFGQYDLAIQSWSKVVELDPSNIGAANNAAWLLATIGDESIQNTNKAIELAERVNELTGYENPGSLDTLAAAYAASGRFDDAVKTAEKAINLAETQNQKELAQRIQERLELYKANLPYKELSPK